MKAYRARMNELRAVVDSALLFRKQRAALPQTLIFFVTSRCNARCHFCLYYDQITHPTAKSDELTPAEVEQVAKQYGPLHYLALSGGEPFVRDDVAALCEPFIEHCGTRVIDIPSNFYFGDKLLDAAAQLAERGVVVDFQLSLDHYGERHDQIRQVPGLYERAKETARDLTALRKRHPNIRLKLNLVYLEENRGALNDILAVFRKDFAFDRVQLSYPNRILPRAGGPLAMQNDVEAFGELTKDIDASNATRMTDLHTLGVRAVKPVALELLRDASTGVRPTGEYCEAGRHIVVLNEKGDVFPCEPLWESIGNVREASYDIGALLRGPKYEAFRERRLGNDPCNCTWSCAMNTHVSVTPELLPQVAIAASRIVAKQLRSPADG